MRVHYARRVRANLARIRLAGAVALASAGAITAIVGLSARAEAGGEPLLAPDLVTLAPKADELIVVAEAERTVLRLSNAISNRGAGPLEVFASATSRNCDGDGDPYNDRDASQRTYADTNVSGVYERGTDVPGLERLFGCMRYHALHDHWHVLNFALYQLRSEQTGKLVATTRKLGFCLGDNTPGLAQPGAAPEQVYPTGSTSPSGCTASTIQGLSIGWVDIYRYDVPGQALSLADAPAGRYCLISRTDPSDLLDETNEDNNVRRTRIALDPEELAVRKLGGHCRA